jgi:hypothetical protein
MSEKHETFADIVAEMRDRKEMLVNAISSAPLCYPVDDMKAKVEILDEFIDRLEAAQKREVGNIQKMREALEAVLCNWTEDGFGFIKESTIEAVKQALAEPPHNGEAGMAEEQTARFDGFCHDHRSPEKGCGDCPLNGRPCCELAWAQMPYESEVKK